VAEAVDGIAKGTSWDSIRFAIAVRDCAVDVTAASPPPAAKRPRSAHGGDGEDLFGEAEFGDVRDVPPALRAATAPGLSVDSVVAAVAAAPGGITRAQLAAALGEHGLDSALERAAGEDDMRIYEAAPGQWRSL
jgi:hypothetical protein